MRLICWWKDDEALSVREKKTKIEIPDEVAALVLFQADRTCCICNQRGRPVQLHHIDEDPSNSIADNLAVLCFDCHRDTQIRGGFDRKLDASQVNLYKADWLRRVKERRNQDQSPAASVESPDEIRTLRYFQLREMSEEYRYEFQADYAQVSTRNRAADAETNLFINAFIIKRLQHFRAGAMDTIDWKNDREIIGSGQDSLMISYETALFSTTLLSLEFNLWSYYAGAVHPNLDIRTLNFRLDPSMKLGLKDIFRSADNGYLKVLSRYCAFDLERQRMQRSHIEWGPEEARDGEKRLATTSVSPEVENFKRVALRKNDIVFHFNPYHVGCYAEGPYTVVVPAAEARKIMQEKIAELLGWR